MYNRSSIEGWLKNGTLGATRMEQLQIPMTTLMNDNSSRAEHPTTTVPEVGACELKSRAGNPWKFLSKISMGTLGILVHTSDQQVTTCTMK